MSTQPVHRILTIDDNPAIHEDFQKIFADHAAPAEALTNLKSSLFGGTSRPDETQDFELDFALQGQEGLKKLRAALSAGRPYTMAFVDVRMPPGWDGIETIAHLWEADPDLQVVICTAFSDYSWDEMRARLHRSDSLVVLKKPFDNIEVLQLAHALVRKRELTYQARTRLEDLDRLVTERTQELQHTNEQLKREMVERARAEECLRQSQKLEAIGQLAAGVAHDFNNILTIIQGHVGLLLASPDPLRTLTESLKHVAGATERAVTLTRQLLVFSRKHVSQPKEVDLNTLLNQTSKLLGRLLGEPVELRVLCTPDLPNVTADPCNLDQVVMNLAVNARDAMPEGGVLTMRTSLEMIDPDYVARQPNARPGVFVCLTVSDTGCGMDAATLSRIFEPFFTTKDVGKGTGLGLATVYGIVQQHRGWIEVASQPGKGATFRVFFPRSENAAPATRQTEFIFRPTPDTLPRRTVLVVEDEPGVREFARTVLAQNSFNVLVAADGVEAAKVWSEHRNEVDLLFTDLVMPNGISGRALADKLQGEAPRLKVIYASGYSAEALGSDWVQSPETHFLTKPYKPEVLLKAIAESLGDLPTKIAA